MTEQEKEALLIRARNDYVEGMEILSAFSGNKFTIKNEKFRFSGRDIRHDDGFQMPIVYNADTEKWAAIISKPQPIEPILYVF